MEDLLKFNLVYLSWLYFISFHFWLYITLRQRIRF